MTPRDIVLVVDDSPATLGMLNETLERAGYTVLVAQSGASALDLVARVTPDIVLLDAIMPGMDGFEVCRRLHRIPGIASVPVIFMTGLTETEHVVMALEVGGVDYVAKPVSPEQVLARIRVHIANARLTNSARAALDVSGRFLLAVDPSGRVNWCTPRAATMLESVGSPPTKALSQRVRDWVTECARLGAGSASTISLPVDPAHGSGAVEIAFLGRIGSDELLLRTTSSDAVKEERLLREKLALTTREAEVLLWVGRGKANRDIADILGMSPRTVNKHLEQIYSKIGVENRAAAAALVIRTLQAG